MMSANSSCSLLGQFLLILGCLALTPSASVAASQEIAGNPLEITVNDDGSIQVNRYELSIDDPGVTQFERQYFTDYYPFLIVDPNVNGVATGATLFSGYNDAVAAVSNVLTNNGNTIVNTTTADNGNITIVQTVTYTPGAESFQHTWVVTNNGTSTYTGVAFRYGGDTYFNGVDLANGFWDQDSNLVYCTDPNASGLMGMEGGPSSPATQYYEDYYYNVWDALESVSAPLPDTVVATYVDNGMGLEWDQSNLLPSQSFTVTAIELWTAAGLVQVLPPSPQTAAIGSPVTLNFEVQNLQNIADTFTLAATAQSGATASAAPTVQVAANSIVTVPVTATVNQYTSTSELVTLTATSNTTPSITNFGATTLTAPPIAPGTVTVVPPATPSYVSLNNLRTMQFTVENGETTSDTFTLNVTGSSGLTIASATSVVIPANSTVTIPVSVTPIVLTLQSQYAITFTATSTTTPSITSSATVPLTAVPLSVVPVTPSLPTFTTSATYSWQIDNENANASETYTFTVSASPGVFVNVPGALPVAAGGTGTVSVQVTTLQPLSTSLDTVTLTAIASSNQNIYAANTISLTPTPVIVVAPPLVAGNVGSVVTKVFTVYNNTGSSASFILAVAASTGLSATFPASVTIPSGASAQVNVQVTIVSSAGIGGTVSLTATAGSATNNGISNVVQTVPLGGPSLNFSQNGQTVYNTISPSTPEGTINIVSVLSAANPDNVAAYSWDATAQAYARLPALPTGGILPSTGIFIASRQALGLDFSGTPSAFPCNLTLQPGWNFIGIPVLSAGGAATPVTSHNFPGDFDFYDNGGALITDPTVLANTLGTVGSTDDTTADPFLYNGTGYIQVSALSTEVGYWIKNNTSGTVTMSRLPVSGGTHLLSHGSVHLNGASTTDDSQGASGSSPVYVDRGEPPPVPGSSSAASSGSSNSCGMGAGVAGLFGVSFLMLRRRLRA